MFCMFHSCYLSPIRCLHGKEHVPLDILAIYYPEPIRSLANTAQHICVQLQMKTDVYL